MATIASYLSLLGLPINDPAVTKFLTENGYKLPKKLEISNKSADREYWIEHKKSDLPDLFFSAQLHHPSYPPIAAESTGMFVPRLSGMKLSDQALDYPNGIKLGMDIPALKECLGEPSKKSSDVAPTLVRDGNEVYYFWHIPFATHPDIRLTLHVWVDDTLESVGLDIVEQNPLFLLRDVLSPKQPADTLMQKHARYMVEWAMRHGHYRGQETSSQEVIENATNVGALYLEQFAPELQNFLRIYVRNLSASDVYYDGDITVTLITDSALLNNPLGSATLEALAAIDYSEATTETIGKVLDKRHTEFKVHKMAKSSKISTRKLP